MEIEEPFEYRQRLTMPKFIVNATGDQFFLPDSSQFYFDELPGAKYLRYVPNADHSLRGSDAWFSVLACYHAILNDAPLPQFTWQIDKDGTIRVRTTDAPSGGHAVAGDQSRRARLPPEFDRRQVEGQRR